MTEASTNPAGAVSISADADQYNLPGYYEQPGGRMSRLGERFRAAPKWLGPAAVLTCIAGALSYTVLSNPTASGADAVPTCLVKLTTGLDCPGCGGTRAAFYLLNGDLPAAARHHLLFVFAVPFLIYMYVAWAGKVAFGWKLPQLKVPPVAIGVFLGAWAVFMVLRNLPFAPFTYFFV